MLSQPQLSYTKLIKRTTMNFSCDHSRRYGIYVFHGKPLVDITVSQCATCL